MSIVKCLDEKFYLEIRGICCISEFILSLVFLNYNF